MATTIIRPTSDSNIGAWTNNVPNTTDLYSYVDEETAVDTDYVQLINSGGSSSVLFGFEDVSLGESPINSLKVYARILFTLNFSYSIQITTHSTSYRRKIGSSSEFQTKSYEWLVNPYTGLAWTETEINDVIIGIYAINTNTKSATAKVSQIYAEVLSGSTNLVPIISVPGTMTNDTTIGTYQTVCDMEEGIFVCAWTGASNDGFVRSFKVELPLIGTNFQINIGDTWKTVESIQINIGDVWKPVTNAQINIGDSWKTIY